MLAITATVSGSSLTSLTFDIDRYPDVCQICHRTGRQTLGDASPVALREGHSYVIYLMMVCQHFQCGRPYLAVYREPESLGVARYEYTETPHPAKRGPTIEAISPDFYEVLDQATAAAGYGLTLIAGAGYRKALEYLVKDYVVRDLRVRLENEREESREIDAQKTEKEIASILDRQLGEIIALIPSEDLRAVAKRAAWLGNDETHYTRKWMKEDLQSLRNVISLLISHIENREIVTELLERMPEP